MAGVALANTIYFPIVSLAPTFTPTLTPTATPTLTPTPRPGVVITYIEADPPGPDIESEYVTIKNETSAAVNMTGWTLMDKAKTTFDFPDKFTLGKGKQVKVWSKAGTDTATDLYWGLTYPIWDNLSDCGYLLDKDGDIEDQYCYTRTP